MPKRCNVSVSTDEERVKRQEELNEQDRINKEQEEQEKRNKDFVQDFRSALPAKRALHADSPWALMIFEFLKTHMDYYNAVVCTSKVLEEYFDISTKTVQRAIKALVTHKFVKIAMLGTCNVYYINSEIAWSSWANQKQYATFAAKVILSKDVQKEYKKSKKVIKDSTKKIKNLLLPKEILDMPENDYNELNSKFTAASQVIEFIQTNEATNELMTELLYRRDNSKEVTV